MPLDGRSDDRAGAFGGDGADLFQPRIGRPGQSRWSCRSPPAAPPIRSGASSPHACPRCWCQQVVVENIGGAGGMTGTAPRRQRAAGRLPICAWQRRHLRDETSRFTRSCPTTPRADFVPVGLVIEQPILLIARNDLPANTVPEFIAYAKVNQARCSTHRPSRVRLPSSPARE